MCKLDDDTNLRDNMNYVEDEEWLQANINGLSVQVSVW